MKIQTHHFKSLMYLCRCLRDARNSRSSIGLVSVHLLAVRRTWAMLRPTEGVPLAYMAWEKEFTNKKQLHDCYGVGTRQ